MRFMSAPSIGQFIPGESFIHGLDPRCKIVATVILMTGLFMASGIPDFLLWFCLLLLCSALSGIKLGVILRSGRPVLFLVLVTVVMNLLWTPGTELARLGPLRITREGVLLASSMGLRLLFLVIFAGMLMMTTSPMAFSDGLERIMSPLSLLRFPTSEMAMMMTIALRFIPTLFEETDRILKAQISRGADFESGGILRRARSFIPILVPLFVLVFQRAENLAVAMESRCYVPGARRSRMNPLKWRGRDSSALAGLALFVVFAIFCDRYLFKAILAWLAMR
ncbi:MAG: energy-coupling factor transporter transmembrane protein EcfT [Synergistaceae bacterium]|jgi:energy-coupling factor transport system permease protein|nr:energy-coupling factor transporter transmembrane protein EcfT [Synergistaceae bacterium]